MRLLIVMHKTIRIIPLKLVPHSDRTAILAAYSRELGRVSFAVNAGSGPAAARRRALLMPLNPIEVVSSARPGRELLTMREPRALMPLHQIISSPERSAVALFMAEVLERVLRQSDPEPLIFDFIIDAISRLNDLRTAPANFHLCFMIRLANMLGIAPDPTDFHPGMIFDMADGIFRLSAPLHGRSLSAADSAVAARLFKMTWQNQHAFSLNRAQRNQILSLILDYYSLHLTDLSNLRSPSILHSLFL
ncbi:MAG: DNA repair protein RecO [Muribaculaceae bacterium]|nr:DNA repair protein RecO [Muribaculaceae bacterium]